MEQREREDLLAIAVDAARRAGHLLVEARGRQPQAVSTKSSRTDMVTDVDRASEALIVAAITDGRPDDAIVGEEGSRREGSTGVSWTIDPLDGTTNYLYGIPAFGVSIAAEVGGETVVAVVHDPNRHETFSAVRGSGESCNGELVAVTDCHELGVALAGTGFSYEAPRRAEQARLLETVLPAVRDIRRVGAAALDLCWVAAGRLDAFFESGLQPWDRAAGELIASEAGAVVWELEVEPSPRLLTVASAPGIAAPLDRLLRHASRTAGRGVFRATRARPR